MIPLLLLLAAGAPETSVAALLEAGRYREALQVAVEARASAERAHGAGAVETLGAMDDWIEARIAMSEVGDEVLGAAREVVRLRGERQGEERALVRSMISLSLAYAKTGNPAEALQEAERASALASRALGPNDELSARALARVASAHYARSELAKAKEAAAAAAPALRGTRSLDAANVLAAVAFRAGELDVALGIYQREIRALERRKLHRHPAAADVLLSMGMTLARMERNDEAIAAIQRAAEIYEETKGPCGDLAYALNSLALRDKYAGNYAGARRSFERALAIADDKLGPEHPIVAGLLNNLGTLTLNMGDALGALGYLRRALEIREKKLGPDNTDVAQALTNIAQAERNLGRLVEARASAQRALEIRERHARDDPRLVARSTAWLGEVELELGNTAKALELLERTVALRASRLGAESTELASGLHALGRALFASGLYAEAEARHRRAIEIVEHAHGKEHPSLAAWRAQLARALLASGKDEEALAEALAAEDIGRAHLALVTRSFAEEESLTYAASLGWGLDVALQIAAQVREGESIASGPSVRSTWEALARSRTLVLDEMVARRRRTATAGGRRSAAVSRLEQARQDLARLLVQGSGREDDAAHAASVEKARAARRAAERALAQMSPKDVGSAEPSFGQIAAALPEGAALVAFARQRRSEAASYFAFVLRERSAEPVLLRLAPAAEVERELAAFESAARDAAGAGAERKLREAGARLRAMIWDPVTSLIASRRAIYVVPAGGMHVLNLGTLPAGETGYLIESEQEIEPLQSERDLLLPSRRAVKKTRLFAIGSPRFDEPRDTGDGRCRFEPLPGAARELEEVVARWKQGRGRAELALGAEATEGAFKRRATGHTTLHIATHGFFDGSECTNNSASVTRGVGGLAPTRPGPAKIVSTELHPLRVSGLALARGPGEEDGILTPEEIASLDLSGTELTVLSACDTGAGEIVVGEGVVGLQRAFLVAGSGAVVMSTWPVEDEAAREWMSAFYARYLGGSGVSAAARGASLELLRARRARGASTHPFWWGAFMTTGDRTRERQAR